MTNNKKVTIWILAISVVALTIYYAVGYNRESSNAIEINNEDYVINFNEIKQILTGQYKDVDLTKKEVCLFINMKNFECHYCYEQFLKIVDMINLKYRKKPESVILLFAENKEEGNFQNIKLKQWLKINKLSYEFLILKNESRDLNLKRSRLILNKNNVTEFTIPMPFSDLDRFEKLFALQ
jgi:hypothetical protein